MKKFAIVFLSLCLVVSLPFAAHANIVTATGKYLINAIKHVPGGAQVNATNTVTGAKHVVKHGVSSADLGKGIGAGIVGMAVGGGVGFAFQAITGLALDAVDWVLDPANNAVKYKTVSDTPIDSLPAGAFENYGLTWNEDREMWGWGSRYFATPDVGCNQFVSSDYKYVGFKYKNPTTMIACYYAPISSPANPPAPIEYWKTISIDTLAAKTLELADSGNAAAQKDVEDHVANKAQNGDLDNELDNAPDITQPEEPNPEEPKECPSGSVKLDNVCVKIPDSDSDEPLFCDSSEFTKKVCDWIDWTQIEHDEPDPDAGKVDVIDKSKDLNIDKNRIDFTNQCPAPTPINTSVGGFPVSTELNYQPLCDFFEMLNPFVIGMGGISSALIIAGGARRG